LILLAIIEFLAVFKRPEIPMAELAQKLAQECLRPVRLGSKAKRAAKNRKKTSTKLAQHFRRIPLPCKTKRLPTLPTPEFPGSPRSRSPVDRQILHDKNMSARSHLAFFGIIIS
jgi:hypothetical protein